MTTKSSAMIQPNVFWSRPALHRWRSALCILSVLVLLVLLAAGCRIESRDKAMQAADSELQPCQQQSADYGRYQVYDGPIPENMKVTYEKIKSLDDDLDLSQIIKKLGLTSSVMSGRIDGIMTPQQHGRSGSVSITTYHAGGLFHIAIKETSMADGATIYEAFLSRSNSP